jgi:hypothetical protein
MDLTTFSATDSVDSLSAEQLELMARTQHDILVHYLETKTHFDVHRVRLLLDLGVIEAKRRREQGR